MSNYATPELLLVGAAQNLVLDTCILPVKSDIGGGPQSCEFDQFPQYREDGQAF